MIDVTQLTKRYYTISEVSKLLGVNKSQLRYWEGEFKQIKPQKGRNGIRRYTKEDITIVEQIQILLKDRGFTIDGAKRELQKSKEQAAAPSGNQKLQNLLQRLKALRDALD